MLPKQLKYGSKVESAAAKSSRVNIAPQNGTGPYNLGDTLVFNIPTRQNLVMCTSESYLKFTLGAITASAAAAIRWDSCGAHGLIQRIRIFMGVTYFLISIIIICLLRCYSTYKCLLMQLMAN